ncbi:hypothetical protein OSG_eHP6_00040 [environmental Halophage eHP-6]|nr:hypothetical protein OSG_eHP6_00040 [environmental Halophage eHP-6]
MTEFGNSRISVTTQGGGIGALNLNVTEKLVIFGRGDPAGGTVNINEPTQVTGPGQLDAVFGADTRINEAMRDAAGNGTAFSVMFGVVPEQVAVTDEAIAGGSGTLDNIPIEDPSLIDIQNTTAGQSESVVFRYEEPIDTSILASGEVAINPDTGAVAAGDTDNYEIDYEYHEWQAAFDSAVDVIDPQEAGQWCVLSDSGSVVSDAVGSITPLRENQFKMIRLAAGAEPNATASDGEPQIDPSAYSDNVADAASFLFGPAREVTATESVRTALGAIGGKMASVPLSESILGESLNGVGDLVQRANVPTQEDLADNEVIPVSDFGSPAIEENLSTSDAGRRQTYFTRRLADRLILAARAIARAVRGDVANPDTAGLVENRLEDEIVSLVDDGLLEPNADDEEKFFVSAQADPNNPKRLIVDFGFTPEGIVDQVEFTATVST